MEMMLFAVPASVLLAVAALAGYALGRNWSCSPAPVDRRERKQAETVARELETIAQEVRRQLATHHASVERFRQRLHEWRSLNAGDALCEGLVAETEQMLDPTLRLAEGMVRAYDQLRRQSTRLNSFQQVRRDTVTGLPNRLALDQTVDSLLEMGERFGTHFCLLLLDFSGREGETQSPLSPVELNERLRRGTEFAQGLIRRTDFVARFCAEELAIVLPQAEFAGAEALARRLSEAWRQAHGRPLPAGIACSTPGDTLRDVVTRADAALYCARTSGGPAVYLHDGERLLASGNVSPPPHTAADARPASPCDAAASLEAELAELLA